jgi:hypothetical protein
MSAFVIPRSNQNSSVGTAVSYDGPTVQDFSLLHVVQTDSRTHPASYPMGTGGSFPGVKRQRRDAGHSSPPTAEVKKGRTSPPLPPYASMV